jgi:hypothetical protein
MNGPLTVDPEASKPVPYEKALQQPAPDAELLRRQRRFSLARQIADAYNRGDVEAVDRLISVLSITALADV